MRVAVLDMEMNQPSGSLIQLGAVCLDIKTGRMESTFNEYINPNEIIDPFIVDLTGIDQETVDKSGTLEQVLKRFWMWCKENKCENIASWGSDNIILLRESRVCGIIPPRLKINLDLKSVFNVARAAFPNKKASGGLKATLLLFNLEFEGRQHDALVDSINTAKLLFLLKEVFFFNIHIGNFRLKTIK